MTSNELNLRILLRALRVLRGDPLTLPCSKSEHPKSSARRPAVPLQTSAPTRSAIPSRPRKDSRSIGDRNLNLTRRFYGFVATVVARYGRRIAFKNVAHDYD